MYKEKMCKEKSLYINYTYNYTWWKYNLKQG